MDRFTKNYFKNLINEAVQTAIQTQTTTGEGTDTRKELWPKIEISVQNNIAYIILQKVGKDDISQFSSNGIQGSIQRLDTGVAKKDTRTGMKYAKGYGSKPGQAQTLRNYSWQFNPIQINEGENIALVTKKWLETDAIKKLGGALKIMAASSTWRYKFDVIREGGKEDMTLEPGNMMMIYRMLGILLLQQAKDAVNIEVLQSKNIDINSVTDELIKAWGSDRFVDLLKQFGHNLEYVEKRYGEVLSDRNKKQIIATALYEGLTPQSPNWPTFVRSRQAWRQLGYYVCDDEAIRFDVNGNPTGLVPREPAVLYPYDAAVAGKATANDVNRGLQMLGHTGETSNSTLVAGKHNSQVRDAAYREVAGWTRGIHGVGYDISDVIPIPGTNIAQKWANDPGLANNLTGELNAAALADSAKSKAEFDKKHLELQKKAEEDPDIANALEKEKKSARDARVYLFGLKLISDNLKDSEKRREAPFTVYFNGDNIGNFVNTIIDWSKSKAESVNVTTKNMDAVAGAIAACVCLRSSIGMERLSQYTKLSDAFMIINGTDNGMNSNQLGEFLPLVLSIQDDMVNELNDAVRILQRQKDNLEFQKATRIDADEPEDETQEEPEDVEQQQNVSINESKLLCEVALIAPKSKQEVLNMLRGYAEKYFAENNSNAALMESKFVKSFNNLLIRMDSLNRCDD